MAPESRRDEGTSYGCRCRGPAFLALFVCEDFERVAPVCGFPVFFFGGAPALPCVFAAAAGCWTGARDWAGWIGCAGCVTVGGAAAGVETVVTGRRWGRRAHEGLP
jgi:hypothetical protein